MIRQLPWAWYLAGLRRYGLPVLLLLALASHILGYLLFGDRPVPQSPPPGYEFTEWRVRLHWSLADLKAPFELQVVRADGDFDAPDLVKEVRSSAHHLTDLAPGTTYRWRVRHPASGYVSPESSFTTARYKIPFF